MTITTTTTPTTHLEREIAEQPEVLRRLLAEQWPVVQGIAAAVRAFEPAFVCIAARGTSDNAARYAQYMLGIHLGLPVALAAPSIHTLYNAPPRLGRALVIGISQSGRAADVAQVLADARGQGALTLSITNDAESLVATSAAHHIPLMAGEEVSVAATKTYTAQLMTVAMLVAALAESGAMHAALRGTPDAVATTLRLSEGIAGWAERYRYMAQFVAIGRGYNYCTAFEINLKVKELCYLIGDGYSEADFLHGPIAMIQPGFPVIVVAPPGATRAPMAALLEKLHERQAEVLVIGAEDDQFPTARQRMHIPADIPEWLTPLLAVIPGQVFAMRLAMARGHEVDRPRGLSKVTVTR